MGRVIFLISEARSKRDIRNAFFDKLKSRIEMGEFKPSKLIIVVEGVIDGQVFGKIRFPSVVDIEPIESLIKDTIGEKEWKVESKERSNLTSAKILVREVTEELNAKGYNAIGIQDEDLESVTKYVSSGVFQSSSDHKIYSQRSGLVDCGPYAGSRTLVIVLDLAL